jgi:hypothetical protein
MNLNDVNIDYYTGTATFFVDTESGSTGTIYKGIFKVKCILSPLEYINADALYRELIGKTNPQFASEYVGQLCYALSQLKFRIMDCPDWFKNRETGIHGSNADDSVLLHVLDKAIDAEAQYREGMKERYEKARHSVKKAIDDKELTDGKESVKTEDVNQSSEE